MELRESPLHNDMLYAKLLDELEDKIVAVTEIGQQLLGSFNKDDSGRPSFWHAMYVKFVL